MNDSIYIFKYEGLWYACPAIQTIVNQVSLPAARADVDEELNPFEIVLPQAFPNGWLLLLSLYFVKNMPFLSFNPRRFLPSGFPWRRTL
jgi:hypothetical protein